MGLSYRLIILLSLLERPSHSNSWLLLSADFLRRRGAQLALAALPHRHDGLEVGHKPVAPTLLGSIQGVLIFAPSSLDLLRFSGLCSPSPLSGFNNAAWGCNLRHLFLAFRILWNISNFHWFAFEHCTVAKIHWLVLGWIWLLVPWSNVELRWALDFIGFIAPYLRASLVRKEKVVSNEERADLWFCHVFVDTFPVVFIVLFARDFLLKANHFVYYEELLKRIFVALEPWVEKCLLCSKSPRWVLIDHSVEEIFTQCRYVRYVLVNVSQIALDVTSQQLFISTTHKKVHSCQEAEVDAAKAENISFVAITSFSEDLRSHKAWSAALQF